MNEEEEREFRRRYRLIPSPFDPNIDPDPDNEFPEFDGSVLEERPPSPPIAMEEDKENVAGPNRGRGRNVRVRRRSQHDEKLFSSPPRKRQRSPDSSPPSN